MPKSRKKSIPVKKKANTAKHREPIQVTEEDKYNFDTKYTSKYLIVNLLNIWRDSAPKGFMTYFPVMVFYLFYCLLWFFVSILLPFQATAEFAYRARNAMCFYAPYIGALILPAIITYNHTRYNLKHKTYWFVKNLLYLIPATYLFIFLCWLNFIVAVMFQPNAGEMITMLVENCWLVLLVAFGLIMLCAAVGQTILMTRKTQDGSYKTELGVELKKK
ncbi:MAG: hypothetical protein IKZ19_06475 [Clostridia bacterium]|nr:hypothetical protein [Clostridia bacterium]